MLIFHTCFLALGVFVAGLNSSDVSDYVKLDFTVGRDSLSEYLQVFPNNKSLPIFAGEINFLTKAIRDWYSVSVYAGSDHTKLDVRLDLASAFLRFFPVNTTVTASSETYCPTLGFNAAGSETFERNSTRDQLYPQYACWGSDDFTFETEAGSLTIPQLDFAVFNSSTNVRNVSLGITSPLGTIGLGVTETILNGFWPYVREGLRVESLPLILKHRNEISKAVYSMYFDSSEAKSGSVLFGAVNHEKYSGQLHTSSNVPSDSKPDPGNVMNIRISSVNLTSGDSSQNHTISPVPIYASFSSGMYSRFPTPMFEPLVASLEANCDRSGNCVVSCDYNTSSAFLDFNFSGVKIRVPLADIIFAYNDRCYLGIKRHYGADLVELADDFLKHAYVVFDTEDLEVSIAPVRFSDNDQIEIVYDSVPSATRVTPRTRATKTRATSSHSVSPFTISRNNSSQRESPSSISVTLSGSTTILDENSGASTAASSGEGQDTSSSTGQGSSNPYVFGVVHGVLSGLMMLFVL